jgi:hypothetical protein
MATSMPPLLLNRLRPASSMMPRSGVVRPATAFSNWLLPAPDGP